MMTALYLLCLYSTCALIGVGLAHLLLNFARRMQIDALHQYRHRRAHVREMKRIRERRAIRPYHA